jgi:hypothetical protein
MIPSVENNIEVLSFPTSSIPGCSTHSSEEIRIDVVYAKLLPELKPPRSALKCWIAAA